MIVVKASTSLSVIYSRKVGHSDLVTVCDKRQFSYTNIESRGDINTRKQIDVQRKA